MRIMLGCGLALFLALFLLFVIAVLMPKMTKEELEYQDALRKEAARNHAIKVDAIQQRIRQGK